MEKTLARTTTALAVLCAPSLALVADAAETEKFVGAWDLVNWVVTNGNGETTHPYGPDAKGQILYTADGQMAVQLMRPAAAATGSPNEAANILDRYFAYYGIYTVDPDSHVVTHHLEGALEPTWIGTMQRRAYRFEDGDRLILSAEVPATDALAGAAGGVNALTWQRAGDH